MENTVDIQAQTPPHARQEVPAIYRWLLLFVIAALCGYLLSPALHAVHLEGFTAQTESIAYLHATHPGLQHDPYLPSVTQFIYQTRSGVVDLLSLIYQLVPNAGDRAYQMLVLASLCVLLLASALFAKRIAGVPIAFSLLAMILTPGIPELGFFFNDNIVSAALAISAITLIGFNSGAVGSLLAGVLFGCALLARLDAILVAPMLIGTVLCQTETWAQRVRSLLIGTLTIAAVLLASAAIHGFSIIDAIYTAQKFTPVIKTQWLWIYVRLMFFGLISLPLIALGCWLFYSRSDARPRWIELATFLIYPFLLVLAAPNATEARYVFPLLAPWVAMHGGRGLQWLVQAWQIPERKRVLTGAGIFLVAVLLLPPSWVQMKDGPRYLVGRVWAVSMWHDWQEAIRESFGNVDAVVQGFENQPLSVLVTTHYNDEFYMRLRLIQAGYLPEETAPLFPGCSGFSVMRKADSIVAHIRTDPQYQQAPVTRAYNAALQMNAAGNCVRLEHPGQIVMTTFGVSATRVFEDFYSLDAVRFERPLYVYFPDGLVKLRHNPVRSYGVFEYTHLSAAEFAKAQAAAARYSASHAESDPVSGEVVNIRNYPAYYAEVQGPTVPYLRKLFPSLTGTGSANLR